MQRRHLGFSGSILSFDLKLIVRYSVKLFSLLVHIFLSKSNFSKLRDITLLFEVVRLYEMSAALLHVENEG